MIQAIFLRRLIKRALTNNSTAPYPTIAGKKVYDSKINELQINEHTESRTPAIVIYTDKTNFIFGDNPDAYEYRAEIDIDVTIECYSFGGDDEKIKSNATFLSMQNDVLVEQVMLSMFNSPNDHTEALRDFIQTFNNVTVDKMALKDIDGSQLNIFNSVIGFKVRVKKDFNSAYLPEDVTKILDLYPEYKYLIDEATMLAELGAIAIDNVEEKLLAVDIKINERFNIGVDTDEV